MKKIFIINFMILIAFLSGCVVEESSVVPDYKSPAENMVYVEGGKFLMGDWLPNEPLLDENGNPVYNSYGDVINKYHDLSEELTNKDNIKDISASKKLKNDFTADARGLHWVEVDDFYIGKYEVTFEEFDIFCYETKGEVHLDGFEGDTEYAITHWGRGKMPAMFVSWVDAVKYCNWLSIKEGLTPCYDVVSDTQIEWNRTADGYRLLTEAEWEYAARGGHYMKYINEGNGSLYSGYNEIPTEDMMMPGDYLTKEEAEEKKLYEPLKEIAWFTLNSGWKGQEDDDIVGRDYPKNDNGKSHQVGTKLPNILGIYDMSGNLWEWCWDFYSKDYYNYFRNMQDNNCIVVNSNTDPDYPKPLNEPVYQKELDSNTGMEVLKLDEKGYPIPVNPNDPKWVYWPKIGDDDYPENDVKIIDIENPKSLPGQAGYNKPLLKRDENGMPIYKSTFTEWKNPIGPFATDPKYSNLYITYGHVLRGGTWGNYPIFLRSTFRFFSKKQNGTKDPYYANWRTGFRIGKSVKK